MKTVQPPSAWPEQFERLEGRFSWKARLTTILTGASGFYMLHVLDAWERFSDPSGLIGTKESLGIGRN
jgi:hypothetical protein